MRRTTSGFGTGVLVILIAATLLAITAPSWGFPWGVWFAGLALGTEVLR